MENIDEFMHQKFNSDDPLERFPFREEYWEQAEAMLAADEAKRRKRRRFVFWWWFCGLLLLSGSGYMAWQWAAREPIAITASNQPTNDIPAKSKAGQPASGTTTNTAIRTEAQRQEIEKQYLRAKLDKADAFDEPATPVSETGQKSTKNSRTTRAAPRKPTPAKADIIKNSPQKSGVGQQKKGGQVITDQATTLPTPGKTRVPAATAATNDTLATTRTALSAEVAMANPADTTRNGTAGIALPTLLTGLEFIPVLIQPLGIVPEQWHLLSFVSPAIIKKAPPQRRFSIGLAAASTVYKNTQVGGNAGILVTYKPSSKWHPFAGMTWRYMPVTGNSAFLQEITDLRYSFGYQSTRWKTETQAVQSLEIPLGIRWQQRRFALEAGITPGTLLRVMATQTKTYTESLQSTPVITTVNVAAKRAAYRQRWVSPFAGVTWQATPQLGVWLRGYYRPTSVILPAPEITVNAAGPYLDLGVYWLLIN